jgi:hypothetical protein
MLSHFENETKDKTLEFLKWVIKPNLETLHQKYGDLCIGEGMLPKALVNLNVIAFEGSTSRV